MLERISAYVMANVGNTFSATSISKFFKSEKKNVASDTILNYIKYCCDAYLFYQVKREDLQGKQILASNEKYYIADHGIREAVFGGNMKDINLILENIVYMELLRRGYEVRVGRSIADHGIREAVFGGNMKDINLILENIVYMELLRRGYEVRVGRSGNNIVYMELLRRGYEVRVGRSGNKEIDFVCYKRDEKIYIQVTYLLASEETIQREFGKRDEKIYIQVTYLLASEETIQREFGVYDDIQDNFPKYVVSLDEFDMSRDGIKHRNIRDFLLYYIADHGIREAVFGGNMKDINLILENIVYMELLRRGYEVRVGRSGNNEIDFVCY